MASVCIVGLPQQLRVRLEAAFQREDIGLVPILAGKGKEGVLWLLPHPREVKSQLHRYVDALPEYTHAKIVVLPYAGLPGELAEELQVLESLGADVLHATPGEGIWPPPLTSNREFDEGFREVLFKALKGLLLPASATPLDRPSVHFAKMRDREPRLLLASTVIRRCDTVTKDRYPFMRDAADALEFLLRGDPGVSIEAFFSSRGLEHAQSGGILAKVTVMKDGKRAHVGETQTHLKCGDATSPAGAARIYYHRFQIDLETYVVVLHAGPHPDRDVDVVIDLDDVDVPDF